MRIYYSNQMIRAVVPDSLILSTVVDNRWEYKEIDEKNGGLTEELLREFVQKASDPIDSPYQLNGKYINGRFWVSPNSKVYPVPQDARRITDEFPNGAPPSEYPEFADWVDYSGDLIWSLSSYSQKPFLKYQSGNPSTVVVYSTQERLQFYQRLYKKVARGYFAEASVVLNSNIPISPIARSEILDYDDRQLAIADNYWLVSAIMSAFGWSAATAKTQVNNFYKKWAEGDSNNTGVLFLGTAKVIKKFADTLEQINDICNNPNNYGGTEASVVSALEDVINDLIITYDLD